MKAILKLPVGLFEDLMGHLLPGRSAREEAAFLFVSHNEQGDADTFEVLASEKLQHADFSVHSGDSIELADSARTRLIKRAHDLKASLVEFHSHPGPWPAGFSEADRIGLRETVPHMFWRLENRPYIAIVVARTGFDALLWIDNPQRPRPLDAMLAGDRLLLPTNNSLGEW